MDSVKDNSMKKYILGAFIITVSLIIISTSMSYAFFVNSVKEVDANKENKNFTISSGELTMTIETGSSAYINATAAGLVHDTNASGEFDKTSVYNNANYTEFTVAIPSSGKVSSAKYDLYLTGNKITPNFKTSSLKWALFDSSQNVVANGDFSTVTGLPASPVAGTQYAVSDIPIKSGLTISKGAPATYRLYVWLSYKSDVQQNELLEGSLVTKVGFTGYSS